VDEVLYQLSTLQVDLKLVPQQEGKWLEFSESVRAYVDDQVRQKFKNQHPSNEPLTGLSYLAKLVDNSSHQYSDLEEIEIKAKAFYPLINNDQRVLFDLRMSLIVMPNVFGPIMEYPISNGAPAPTLNPIQVNSPPQNR
jgi:hypothetical protein